MRVLLHDYGRFPFIYQLAHKLAEDGMDVLYVCSAAVPERASLDGDSTPSRLRTVAIPVAGKLAKRHLVRRWAQEVAHGKAVVKEIQSFSPDVVASTNTPLDPQAIIQRCCRRKGIRFVYWLQDIYGIAIREVLRRQLPLAGAPVAARYIRLERRLLERSDAILTITDDFRPYLHQLSIGAERVHSLANWAPLPSIPVRPKDNRWARSHGLEKSQCVLYAGTLGMKHNPQVFVDLAISLRRMPDARVVVVSTAAGIAWLKEERNRLDLSNLVLLPLQREADLPDVLATADILLAILEESASSFSVPSKVLTYMCAGRALLLGVPRENEVARVVREERMGLVVEPSQGPTLVEAASCMLGEPEFMSFCAANARRYAEEHFDIEVIASTFKEAVTPAPRKVAAGLRAADLL